MSALPRLLSSVSLIPLLAAPLATACVITSPGPVAPGPVAPPPASNLIVNGGFEDPSIAPGTWSAFPALPGWQVVDGGVVEVQNRVAGEPASGAQLVELDGDRSAAIAQDVATRAGARYRLTYHFAARPGTGRQDNRLEVRWNGAVVDRVAARGGDQTQWIERVVDVDGVDGPSHLELIDRGHSNGMGTYLDDVSLIDVSGQPVVAQPPIDPVDIVVNGGFEAPAVAPGAYQILADAPGWHTIAGPGMEIQNHAAGDPASGAQLLELDGDAASSIAQDLPTRAGARYRVTYRFSARPGTSRDDNRLEVRWSGNVVDQVDAAGSDRTEWITRSVEVDTWHDGDRLELIDLGRSNGVGTYVDDVSVVQIGYAVAR